MTSTLLDYGASIECSVGPHGLTPLHLAVSTRSEDLVKLLLERGANPMARLRRASTEACCQPELDGGETVLHTAITTVKTALLPLLLAAGVNVSSEGIYLGRTPLHVAASRGDEATARMLLDAGADISAWCYDGRTPLHLAAEHGRVGVIKLLLGRAADAMATTPDGQTPLSLAASGGKEEAMSVLLRQTSDVLTVGQKATVMISAAKGGSLDVVELLVREGFSVNACDEKSQFSALEAAAVHSHEAVVIFLLRNGATPNASAIRASSQISQGSIRGLLDGTLPLPPGSPVK
ncbi:uncharacterized protein DNG_04436 [Cephalotrichum gorgonifer]|uniref:Uncharacterized protein n=1 Tax=Cephalotrichum gorgonifer TaxID=2041049 RepID=A0AAE8MYJ0_9PEZI|nr:uncharacterized protein DNG_04436 [Cephalotrichum gorgonifer]